MANTVARCQALVTEIRKLTGAAVLCYHSRFRLRDRKDRHEDAIEAFRRSQAVVLVTTQVCEMSLDLDADLLITEAAPIPSLIQRFGRCFRRPAREDEFGEIFVYWPENEWPYERPDLEQARPFVDELASIGRLVSQADLARMVGAMEVLNAFAANGYVGFLDSGFFASSREEGFREGDEFTVDCVLDTDIDEYRVLADRREPRARGLVLPVPRYLSSTDSRLRGGLRSASASHYDQFTGFHDCEVKVG